MDPDFYICTVLSASIMQIIRWIIWSSNEKGMVSISVFGVAPSLISLEAFWQERFGRWPLFLGAPHSPLPSFVVPPLCFVLPVQFCVFHFLVFSGLYCLFTMQSVLKTLPVFPQYVLFLLYTLKMCIMYFYVHMFKICLMAIKSCGWLSMNTYLPSSFTRKCTLRAGETRNIHFAPTNQPCRYWAGGPIKAGRVW